MFKEFFMIFSLILVHEIGHLIFSLIYKWNLSNITIYPFGGCVKFDERINRSIKEEVLILIGGPLFQIIFYLFLNYISSFGFITYRNMLLLKNYHYTLLFFNLLPIYPLDGGRILNLIFNYLFPYKKGNKRVILISIVMIFISILFYKNVNFILMGLLLFFEVIIYFKRQDYLYNRLLLERYLSYIPFKKFKIIRDKESMYKDKRHIILYGNKYITEKEYLIKRFR